MITWTFWVCVGVSAMGCGAVQETQGLDLKTCQEAVMWTKQLDAPYASADASKRATVAMCKPVKSP